TLEAAAAVCAAAGGPVAGAPDAVLDGVSSLVDKSLLRPEGDGPGGRYAMLETVREFGLEELAASGEEGAARRAHAAHFRALAETAESRLRGADQITWLDRLAIEHDNLRAALDWGCEQRDAETALVIGGSLSDFWRTGGHLGEGRGWLERALALADDRPSAARARALLGAGALAKAQGDDDHASTRLAASLAAWRALGDHRRAGQTLALLAGIARGRGDYRRATELNEEALCLFEGITDREGIADTLNQLGMIAADRAEYERARSLYERSLALYQGLADRHGPGRVLNNLGVLAFWQEDYRRAAGLFAESLELWRAMGERPNAAVVLANLGEALRAEGDLPRAEAVAREGLVLSREVGDKRSAATALFILGSLAQHHCYDPRAIDPLVEGLSLYRQVGDRLGVAWCFEALAGPATAGGRPDLAALLLGAAEALREQVSIPLQPAERPSYQRHLDATRSALGQAAFDAAWARGRALPLETVAALPAELVPEPIPGAGTAVPGTAGEGPPPPN
ncbi:MAG: hypothetical protein AVDCRST_MAG19-777, partial [uncultured Thermomicrobiales bacterium]